MQTVVALHVYLRKSLLGQLRVPSLLTDFPGILTELGDTEVHDRYSTVCHTDGTRV
jgi:hypothetical protein